MKQKIINILLCMTIIPIVLFEYFVLFWFWGGADAFNFISTPIIFFIYLIAIMYLKKRINLKGSLVFFVSFFSMVILPILTIFTVRVFALLFGINIKIL